MADTAFILVAAGKSARMGLSVPKPYLPLAGRPLLTHSLATLSALPKVRRAVLVAAADRQSEARAIVEQYGPWPVPVEVVAGGAERQDSVSAGLAIVNEELVLIHDAARPFVSTEIAAQCLAAAAHDGAAIVALAAHDTVKLADEANRIAATLDRNRVWLAQTPQAFRTELLRRAIAAARARGEVLTDDAAAVEAIGAPVQLVPGDPNNRKITTAADYEWAQWFAARP